MLSRFLKKSVAIRCHRQTDEKTLVVEADGAGGRGGWTFVDMAAIEAEPLRFRIFRKEFFLLDEICKFTKAVAVVHLYLGNAVKGVGNGGEALLLCTVAKDGINALVFLVFVVLGGEEQG